jgi:hypothetical protein
VRAPARLVGQDDPDMAARDRGDQLPDPAALALTPGLAPLAVGRAGAPCAPRFLSLLLDGLACGAPR